MKKIRINELARELEVKSKEIIDALPEMGILEKLTHSSSLDDDLVYRIRKHFGFEVGEPPQPPGRDEHAAPAVEARHEAEAPKPVHAKPSVAVEPPAAKEVEPETIPVAAPPAAPPPGPVKPKPIRPPLAGQRGEPVVPAAPPSSPAARVPSMPRPGASVPARPVPTAPKPGQILSGPRAPLPSDLAKLEVAPPLPAPPAPPQAIPGAPMPVVAPGPPRHAPAQPRPAAPRAPAAH